MKRLFSGWLISFLFSFFVFSSAALLAGNYKNFRVSVYARSYEVQQMKDLTWLQTRWEAIEKQVKVDKIYLETHRDLVVPDEATIEQAQKFFTSRGIQVAGGITATVNERNRFQTFCYTNPEQRKKVKEVVELTARHFDELILDDFFFTNCKCETCIRAKGARSWSQFRLELMSQATRELVIQAAKAVNPKIKVVIKYPNWYDHFQNLGFNLEMGPPMFDGIYTGTETRDPIYSNQHLQPYHGYSIFRYFENIKPGGNGGGWVDPPGRVTLDHYAEQLWVTLFAKAPEITLFDFRQLYEPIRQMDGSAVPATMVGRVAGYAFEQVDGFLGALGKPVGVPSYKPFHSSGEDFLQSFFGMIGIPMDITSQFPASAPTVLLTEAAKYDGALVEKIKGQLMNGKTVIITSGLLRALQGKGIEDIVELECTDKKAYPKDFLSRWTVVHGDTEIAIPQIRYATNDAWETISGLDQGLGYPLLLQAGYAKGNLYVFTIPDNFGNLYHLPAEVLNLTREIVSKDLFVRLEGPSQFCLFAYDNHTFIVESFLPHMSSVKLVLDKKFSKLRDLSSSGGFPGMSGQGMPGQSRGDKMVFETFLAPHSFRVFAAE
jgi:hypothetical protein